MLANDGAEVTSFDIDGAQLFVPSSLRQAHEVRETNRDRKAALADADIVITGVPNREFQRIAASEIRAGITALNFSTRANFEPKRSTRSKFSYRAWAR